MWGIFEGGEGLEDFSLFRFEVAGATDSEGSEVETDNHTSLYTGFMVGMEIDMVGSICWFTVYTEKRVGVSVVDHNIKEREGVVGFSFICEVDGGFDGV